MAYDATKMQDWEIAEASEPNMPTPDEWREKLGLEQNELMAYGKLAKLDFMKIIDRLKDKPDGKYIEVTAISPTPLGEGKSTTSLGLIEGLGKRGGDLCRGYPRAWAGNRDGNPQLRQGIGARYLSPGPG